MSKISLVSQKRMSNVISWIGNFKDYRDLMVTVEDMLRCLTFGTKADRFEGALNQLATALGFIGQRPDKEWKEGPDNLWALRDKEFLLVECKNEVDLKRAAINEHETEQMNRSHAWFERYYPYAKATNIMIIPTNKLADDAGLLSEVVVIEEKGLTRLTTNVRGFFHEFREMDLRDVSEKKVQELIDAHKLSVDALTTEYVKPIRPWRATS